MRKFFRCLRNYVGNTEVESIADLTKKIMVDAGYHRGEYKQKNGKIKIRTMYDKDFNSLDLAKWLLFYKKIFISKLQRHTDLTEKYVDIINATYESVFNALQLDKIVCDDVVNKYVNMALSSRIKDFSFAVSSIGKIVALEKYNSRLFYVKDGINSLTVPLENFINEEDGCGVVESSSLVEPKTIEEDIIVYDLNQKLKGNKLGQKLLEVLLTNGKKVQLKNINDYIKFENDNITIEQKTQLEEAMEVIKNTLKDYLLTEGRDVSQYNWKSNRVAKFR